MQFDDHFYAIGSGLFAIGSLFLVAATVGPGPKGPDWLHLFTNLFTKEWSLFWGSVCFFVGSCVFLYDSFSVSESMVLNTKLGYVMFVFGRLAFLWGKFPMDSCLNFSS